MTRQRAFQTVLGLVISAACLWLVSREVPFAQVGLALKQAHFWWLVPALLALAGDVIIRAERWSVLLRPMAAISWRRLLSPTIIGYMGNAVLPARLGEVLRATLLGRVLQDAAPAGARLSDWTSAALGSVALERLLDGIVTVAILAVTARLVPHPAWLTTGLDAVAAVCFALIIMLAVLVVFRPAVIRLLHRWFGHLAWAARPLGWIDHLLAGLEALRNPRLMIRALALTVVIWGVGVLEFYWVIRAFDLPLDMIQAAFLMVGIGLATVIPSAPAALGTFELASMALLAMLGIEKAAAFSFTIVMHLMWSVPLLLTGLLLMWWSGFFVPKPKRTSDRPV